MKNIFLLVIVIFSINFFGFGQANISKELVEAVPSSPSMDGFKKYTNFPVDKHTGIPSIDYSIYNFNVDGVDFGVSLSYHASGIRVTEVASTVGLGWNLFAAGAINIQVMGMPDSYDAGYSSVGNDSDEIGNFLNLANNYANLSQIDKDHVDAFKKNSYELSVDREPDIYSFNFLGKSGKFVFTPSRNIVLLDKQDILVKGTPEGGFEITDENGNKFFFDISGSEDTSVFPKTYSVGGVSLGEDYDYISSWKLTKIVTHLGNEINLTYTNQSVEVFSLPSQVLEYVSDGQPDGGGTRDQLLTSYALTNVTEKLISSITFPEGVINFNYSSDRQDINSGKKLNLIQVYDKNSKFIKEERFEYGYFNEYNLKRLKLNSIQKYSNNILLPKTEYTYYSPNGLANDYQTKSTDFFGYYNGKANGIYIPKDGFYDWLKFRGSMYYTQLADKDPSFDHTVAGVLETVKYPTGGTTTYTYEQNNYGYVNSGEVSSSTNANDDFEYTTPKVTGAVSCGIAYQDESMCGITANPITSCDNATYIADVTFIEEESLTIKTFIAPESFDNLFFIYTSTDGNEDMQGVGVSIEDLSGNIIFSYMNYAGTSYPTKTSPTIDELNDPNIIKLNEGQEYKIICSSEDECNAAYIGIHKVEPVTDEQGDPIFVNPKTGGLRIQEITKKDNDGNLELKRTYEYKMEDDIRSSGVVKTEYYNKLYSAFYYYAMDPFQRNDKEITRIFSSSLIPFGHFKGSNVTYRRVIERIEDFENDKSQTIEYYYTSPFNFWDDKAAISYPYTTRININYRLGLLYKKIIKDEDSNEIKVDDYLYEFVNNPVENVHGVSFGCTEFLNNVPWHSEHVIFNSYTHDYLNISLLNKETSVLTLEDITTEKSYFYNNTDSSLLTKTETKDSNENLLVTNIYYPDDIVSTTSLSGKSLTDLQYYAIDSLKSVRSNGLKGQHRIAIPIQTETYKNGVLLNTTRANFKQWDPKALSTGNIIEQESVETSLGVEVLEPRITYHDYDAYGNPLEVSKKDGTHTVYIWGYNYTKPIAKIENTTYLDIPSATIVNLQTLSNQDTDDVTEEALRVALENLRNLAVLTDSYVTTYTYDPLIGVTSITSPSGYTSYYEYDDFNRLKYIKNKDEEILKSYDYNYKQESQAVTQYSISATTNGNGTVSFGSTIVNEGDNVLVSILPDVGYDITSIKVNGVTQSISNSFTITNITSNTIVDVEFSIKTYTVTKTIDSGSGTVSISPAIVDHGSSTTITLYPSSGFEADYIKVGGLSYTITNNAASIFGITSNTTVNVAFKALAATLVVTPTSLSFDFIDMNKTVTVFSSGSWTVSKSASWIIISTTSGSNNGTFTVRPLKNLGSQRLGTVTVSNGSITRTIFIEQLGDDMEPF